MTILFIKPIDQDPFHHSFMNGVLVEEFSKKNVPVFIVQQTIQRTIPRILRKNICTLFTIHYYSSDNPLASIVYGIINFLGLYTKILEVLIFHKITHVIVRSEWWSLVFVSFLRLFITIPLIYQESFPMEEYGLTQTSSNTQKNKLRKLFLEFRKNTKYKLMQKCDSVFVMSEAMEKMLIEKGVEKSKILITPMGISTNEKMSDVGSVNLFEQHHNKFIICYNGTMAPIRMPEMMVSAFDLAKSQCPNMVFLFVGGTSQEIDQLSKIRPQILNNQDYIVIENVERQKACAYLKIADIGISIIPPIDLFKVGSVTKLVEMLYYSLPVVANIEIPEQETMSRECAAVFPCFFNEASIANAILTAYNKKHLLPEIGEEGKKYVLKNRSYEKISEDIYATLRRIDHKEN